VNGTRTVDRTLKTLRDLEKRPRKETYKRDLQKRPTKETYKRDLQKRTISREWYKNRGQNLKDSKRPTKETYKRDLQKRPTKENHLMREMVWVQEPWTEPSRDLYPINL